MTVFVAYGYTSGERWVRDLIVPLLGNLGIKVVGGEEIPGKRIDNELQSRIAGADALIGFLLRRKKNPDGSYSTSDYVQDELRIAHGYDRDVVQVVEAGVRVPGGFLAGIQHLPYDRKMRDQFLFQLTGHVRAWITGEVYVRLAPAEVVDDIAAAVLHQPRCEYSIVDDGHRGALRQAQVLPIGGGMYVKLLGFGPGTFADVTITTSTTRWSCRGVAHSLPFVTVPLARLP